MSRSIEPGVYEATVTSAKRVRGVPVVRYKVKKVVAKVKAPDSARVLTVEHAHSERHDVLVISDGDTVHIYQGPESVDLSPDGVKWLINALLKALHEKKEDGGRRKARYIAWVEEET